MRVNLTPQVGHWKGRSGPLAPGRAEGLMYRWYGYWMPSSLEHTHTQSQSEARPLTQAPPSR